MMKINNVLIVEDDLQIANILAKTINKEENFEVIGIASTADEAIDLLQCFTPELVFLDVSLLDSNGLDVLKFIRKELSSANISVVMLTAAKDSEIIQQAMSFGAFDYILKPIAFTRLKTTLQRFLQYNLTLTTNQTLEQEDVDALFHNVAETSNVGPITKETGKAEVLPKGIDPITLDKIRSVLSKNPGLMYTAESMSEYIGTSRTTARRYLEFLLKTEETIADIEYGTVGRPERNYRLK